MVMDAMSMTELVPPSPSLRPLLRLSASLYLPFSHLTLPPSLVPNFSHSCIYMLGVVSSLPTHNWEDNLSELAAQFSKQHDGRGASPEILLLRKSVWCS